MYKSTDSKIIEYFMKGELMKEKSKKKKVTLFLDTDTLAILEKVSYDLDRGSNKSGAVRFLAKEYEKREIQKTTN
jgi:hypothetical protein